MSRIAVDITDKTYPRGMGGGSIEVLRDMRFAVEEGEFVCLVGPSGCGKTTTLNLVCGLDTAFDGEILIAGRRPPGGPKVGYMFQNPRLMPWLTVRENIELVLGDEPESGRQVDTLLAEMRLSDSADVYPGRLSGGMQRRVALARAFAGDPGLLLLDEPFLSLDVPVANRLRVLLLDLCRRRPTTVLFVTHDLREALFLADRILFLSAGPARIVLDLVVDLPRPRNPESAEIEALRLKLLEEQPDLLAGLAKLGDDV